MLSYYLTQDLDNARYDCMYDAWPSEVQHFVSANPLENFGLKSQSKFCMPLLEDSNRTQSESFYLCFTVIMMILTKDKL